MQLQRRQLRLHTKCFKRCVLYCVCLCLFVFVCVSYVCFGLFRLSTVRLLQQTRRNGTQDSTSPLTLFVPASSLPAGVCSSPATATVTGELRRFDGRRVRVFDTIACSMQTRFYSNSIRQCIVTTEGISILVCSLAAIHCMSCLFRLCLSYERTRIH